MASALIATIVIAAGLVAVLVRRNAARQRDIERLTRQLADANARFAEREQLAAVGEMVSGLAQELKKPLQDVLGNTELMLATSASRSDLVTRALDSCQQDLASQGVAVTRTSMERLPLAYVDGRQLEKVFAALAGRPARAAAALGTAPDQPYTLKISLARLGAWTVLPASSSSDSPARSDRIVVSFEDSGPPTGNERTFGASGPPAWRQVVQAHGGSLSVDFLSPSSGVRTTIELPISAVGAQERARPWTESSISSTSTATDISKS